MPEDRFDFDGRLLGLHLGQLSADERERLQAELQRDARLAAQDQTLRELFAALNRYDVPPAPADLTRRIMTRVRREAAVVQPAGTAPVDDNPHLIRLYGFRDVIAVAAMIVLAIGLGVPGLLHMRERARRTQCAANLAQIGQGMQAYASVFHDSLPFVGWLRDRNSWIPTNEPGVTVLPNRRHVYVLVRNGFTPARVFVCPSSRGVPMPQDEVRRHDNFLESRNVSYAYQNMAGKRPVLGRADARMPVLGDDNPIFDDVRTLLGFGWWNRAQRNSPDHGGAGQNLLSLDGTVRWTNTPFAGVGGDNIWTLNGVRQYTGHEGPEVSTDSHLIK